MKGRGEMMGNVNYNNTSRKFHREEMSRDTYSLLQELGVTPRTSTVDGAIKEIKESLGWLIDENYGKKNIDLLAFSGEADPKLWNAVEEELMTALNEGMTYVHCLGPIVCTDEGGRNAILEAYEKYPEKVVLKLFRTRQVYHWMCFTSRRNDELAFRFRGETYHEPLTETRKCYSFSLESNNDPFLSQKIAYWHNRQWEYQCLRAIMDDVSDLNEVPTITKQLLEKVEEETRRKGKNFNLLTSKEILAVSHYIS